MYVRGILFRASWFLHVSIELNVSLPSILLFDPPGGAGGLFFRPDLATHRPPGEDPGQRRLRSRDRSHAHSTKWRAWREPTL